MSHKALLEFCYKMVPDVLWTNVGGVQFKSLHINGCYFMRYQAHVSSSVNVVFGVSVGLNAEYIGAFGI